MIRFSRYQLERQLLGGIRAHQRKAPFHGAHRDDYWRGAYFRKMRTIVADSFHYAPMSHVTPYNLFPVADRQTGFVDVSHPAFHLNHAFTLGRLLVLNT